MSTPATIYLKLNEKDKGTTVKFHITKLGHSYRNNMYYLLRPILDVSIPKNAEYMTVWHHWDGHIHSLGLELFKTYNTYDKVRNLLTMGDLSSIMTNNGFNSVCSYQGAYGYNTLPKFIDMKTPIREMKRVNGEITYEEVPFLGKNGELPAKHATRETFAYLFDGKKWWVSWYSYEPNTDNYIFHDWTDLYDALKEDLADPIWFKQRQEIDKFAEKYN